MEASDMKQDVADPTSNRESNQLPSSSKGLFVLVIVLGIMIVIGTVALLWVIIHRMSHPHTEPTRDVAHPVQASMVTEPALLSIPRHGDEQIRSVTSRTDGTLAVTMASPQGGGRIVVWWPEQARVVAEFDLGMSRP